VVKKALAVLALVLVGTSLFAVCLVSAIQLLKPHDMPFGVTGSSPLVKVVQAEASKKGASIDLIRYASEADLIQAAEQGDLYGGLVPGRSADTLVTVPAQSFFGEIYVRGAFTDAAKKAKRTITTKTIAPLPTSDRTGAVVDLQEQRRRREHDKRHLQRKHRSRVSTRVDAWPRGRCAGHLRDRPADFQARSVEARPRSK